MKEWIYKDGSGQYVLTTNPEVANLASDAVEVPQKYDAYIELTFGKRVFYKWHTNGYCMVDSSRLNLLEEFFPKIKSVLWKRNKNITGISDMAICEPPTAEVARQKEKHSHYKKDVSHLNVIDPYRIADLYDLHPCAEHIMKKSLCAGNRGHKDTLRDIQDIIDTAERWKQMIEEDNNEI